MLDISPCCIIVNNDVTIWKLCTVNEKIACYVPLTLHEKWTILTRIKGK